MDIPGLIAHGIALHQSGRIQEAESVYRQVLAAKPDNGDALHLLGLIAHAAGDHNAAEGLIARALAAVPNAPLFHYNLGMVLQETGRLDEAVRCFNRAAELKPDYVEALDALGSALTAAGRIDEALPILHRAVQLNPNDPLIHLHAGIALKAAGRTEPAVAAFTHALRLAPTFGEALNNLGLTLCDLGRSAEGVDALQRALELKPIDAQIHSNLILQLHYVAGDDGERMAYEHRRWAQRHAAPLARQIQPHCNNRDPGRRLRIGYVSPDFCRHAVASFVEPILAHHNPAEFELYCYADELQPDAVTKRFQCLAHQWRNVTSLGDAQCAKLIRSDGIDLLIDLAGHTAHNRLGVFARKPAPVQITYGGYPNTTGLRCVDFRLTDAYADPPGETERFHSEQLVRLPGCAWCFQTPDIDVPVAVRRSNDPVTFGCFNAFKKISPQSLELWSAILKRVPNSKLLLKTAVQGTQLMLDRFRAEGVSNDQLEIIDGGVTFERHLALHGRVDLMLDPYPYHGTTTTCEALWMGVPVLTLQGRTHVCRVGTSLLSAVGLQAFIASTHGEYVNAAVRFANDREPLHALRSTMRERIERSGLIDGMRFTRALESTYQQLWAQWCLRSE
jgi:predicted O-linked N-acetylglucosamine transferase (SPINDLY family)